MSAPRILIPSRRESRNDLPIQFVHQKHIEALLTVGALPVPVPALGRTTELLEAYLTQADGLLLAEGGDVMPRDLDEVDESEFKDVDLEKDEVEMALAAHALRAGLPTLATCRGAQVMNVVAGGTLHTHLPRDVGEVVRHVDGENYDGVRHPMTIRPDSPLYRIYEATEISVTTVHHQGIARLADRFVADGHAPDRLIEAFHDPDHPFLVCVQHHPERQFDEHPGHLGLYRALADAARLGAQTGGAVGSRRG